ncbi:Hypothetical protein R9X50_00177200 [Acrodontium crateriforme]|uniref:Coenzyme Q-binding protein COQ10 START domain-containing protein n=1 Tax=Acrodontium crateriforme TaxID=150365 RepID=A0AAQ3R310_9PEZI|nr:Hypothetical protein R9X50_00177200 [Acrodontium crateriforme]
MQSLRPISNGFLLASTRTPRTAHQSVFTALNHHYRQQRRTFLPSFLSSPQTLNASRTLPYPPSTIYSIISDVASYSQFLPYCQESLVTKTSASAPDGKTYPEEAKLTIGFNSDVSEQFWSRIYCVPDRVVEAIGGETETALPAAEIKHHNPRPAFEQDPTRNSSVLSKLATRWTIQPNGNMTEVNLAIEYQFANPMYAALSSAAAPMVADKMIEAFEKRVKDVAEMKSR